MKSNFEFLKEYWPALAQIGETAENYLYSDPNACILKNYNIWRHIMNCMNLLPTRKTLRHR